MIKPDWSKAPEWAEWWAVDWIGMSYFYKNKPVLIEGEQAWTAENIEFVDDELYGGYVENWKETLTQRPQSSVTETTTVTIELTSTELSILVTALGYAYNIDLDAVQPLQRKIIEIYKEANK